MTHVDTQARALSALRQENFATTMIKQAFIKTQVAKSASQGRTSAFLRRLILAAVDEVAHEHYGAEYPAKCMQVSGGIQRALGHFGIGSRLWMGAVCVAEVFEEPGHESWGGFWDQDHHIWLVTAYREYVDLSISQVHLHPSRRRNDGLPIPALWWNDVTQWPPVLRYLPDAPIKIGLDGEEAIDLEAFLSKVGVALDARLAGGAVQDVYFPPILSGIASMDEGFDRGDPWLTRAIVFQQAGIPFPPWIQERELEMRTAAGSGKTPPSRLANVPGMVRPS